MVAGEWRAVTLASEGWPGLVSWPTTSSPKLPVGQNCRFESRKLYLTPKKHGREIFLFLFIIGGNHDTFQ